MAVQEVKYNCVKRRSTSTKWPSPNELGHFLVSDGSWAVSSVDLGVHWHVAIPGGKDPVMSIGKNGGQRFGSALAGFVKHLGLQFRELVLQFREVIGKGVNDAGVNGAEHTLIGSSEVLGSCKRESSNQSDNSEYYVCLVGLLSSPAGLSIGF